MKKLIAAALLVSCIVNNLCAQTDYCNRISIAKTEKTDSGYKAYIAPHFRNIPGDKRQAFYHKFHYRFEYILFNKIDYMSADLHKSLKDTAELNRRFCDLLTREKQLRSYFDILANEQQGKKPDYTVAEMMHIAARFFWLDDSEADGWLYYICIGNNGQKEGIREQDYSVLEAFCFEAIFSYMKKSKRPGFAIASDKYFNEINQAASGKKDRAAVLDARQNLYHKMEVETSLRKALLRYYRRYGKTFGFQLTDV